MDEDPVCDEPAKDVDQVEAGGVRPEEDVGGEGGEGAGQHALRERLDGHCVRNHGKPQLRPPGKWKLSLCSVRW